MFHHPVGLIPHDLLFVFLFLVVVPLFVLVLFVFFVVPVKNGGDFCRSRPSTDTTSTESPKSNSIIEAAWAGTVWMTGAPRIWASRCT